MKLSHILGVVVGSAAAGMLANTSPAHALDFNFTFTGTDGTVVNGTIDGLVNNTTNESASSVVVTSVSNSDTSVVGLNWVSNSNLVVVSNSFTVANGVITNANFASQGGVLQLLLDYDLLGIGGIYQNYLHDHNTNTYNNAPTVALGFGGALYSSASVPFDIPGGATIPSVGALLALGAMRKARKSIASKTRLANPVCASVS
jgi:hypothetical protein